MVPQSLTRASARSISSGCPVHRRLLCLKATRHASVLTLVFDHRISLGGSPERRQSIDLALVESLSLTAQRTTEMESTKSTQREDHSLNQHSTPPLTNHTSKPPPCNATTSWRPQMPRPQLHRNRAGGEDRPKEWKEKALAA